MVLILNTGMHLRITSYKPTSLPKNKGTSSEQDVPLAFVRWLMSEAIYAMSRSYNESKLK